MVKFADLGIEKHVGTSGTAPQGYRSRVSKGNQTILVGSSHDPVKSLRQLTVVL